MVLYILLSYPSLSLFPLFRTSLHFRRKWRAWGPVGAPVFAQSRPTHGDSMGCSLPGSSVHGILQARILGWVAMPFIRGSSQSRDWTYVSCIAARLSTAWATREARETLDLSICCTLYLKYWSLLKIYWSLTIYTLVSLLLCDYFLLPLLFLYIGITRISFFKHTDTWTPSKIKWISISKC